MVASHCLKIFHFNFKANNMSKRKRAQVDDDSFDEQAELDLTGGENDLANIVVSDGEGGDVTMPPPKKRKKNKPNLA